MAVASYHLDPWGNFRFPTELTHSANRFAFTGHIWDEETGLYNAKARYFDPKLGRFLTQDSFLGHINNPPTLHRYSYAADRPTFYVDPTGHMSRRLQEYYAQVEAQMRAAGTDEQRVKIWTEGFGRTVAPANRAANEVAAPITSRLEGMSNLVAPVSFLRNPKGEGASLTRQRQYQLLDQAFDSRNSAGTRLAAGAGAALLQPGAALNDIVHGLAGVPGKLDEAGSHAKQAFQAENLTGFGYEMTEAVEKTANAAETTISAFLLLRGATESVARARADQAGVESLVKARAERMRAGTETGFETLGRNRQTFRGMSEVKESIPDPDGNPILDIHVEEQLRPGGTDYVDQIPCLVCRLDAEATGTRIVVPENPLKPGASPKSAARSAAKGLSSVQPRVVVEGAKPLLVPVLPPSPQEKREEQGGTQ